MIDVDSDNEIHTHINASTSVSDTPCSRQGSWGIYNKKPVCQSLWETTVRHEVAKIEQPKSKDLRPRLLDTISGLPILIDSGASTSIWPKNSRHFQKDKLQPDNGRYLKAVNGTSIPTYGTYSVKIKPQKVGPYFHDFIIADVDVPIFSWDFILKYKLDLNWSHDNCLLIDQIRGQSIPLKWEKINTDYMSLALVSFRQYSQAKSADNSHKQQKIPIPPKYQHR